ncbi:YeiH family protein [Alkaliphilus peptidifermentans]|uniref:Conserved hypothetical integral membrane protein n=1 Tax=Alkaliphilus peptidifermentans DSM 18978 TaxID=1120976 RepID=A0A1G5IJ44_9FIRM|nr:YeiH family protein [Alkaliphilus peptidifermentans]SCY75448.1 conserved hypothetical integral membrane protein [Alkaliphilus peptidifermentans DSM 18978]
MTYIKSITGGTLLAVALALLSIFISNLMANHIIGAGVFALLIGMLLNPVVSKYDIFENGLSFTSKKILRFAIILMGFTLSFSQVIEIGKFSLIVMVFTLFTAFAGGYLLGRLLKMDWKLSGLISAGTGICGGSAVAAIAPVIDANDGDIAYAISATIIFDIIMVILFPLMGTYFGMTDLGYGLWAGTAINDTSSVVAAGYAFSDVAGNFSVIVKLTRTFSIVPVVLVFSYINASVKRRSYNTVSEENQVENPNRNNKVDIKKIFPWFILMFLGMVAIKSSGVIPQTVSDTISSTSKFLMVMSLGAIGLKTNFSSLSKSGFTPILHGFVISSLVVMVSFFVQVTLGQV